MTTRRSGYDHPSGVIRCTGCGREPSSVAAVGDTTPGVVDWFCSQACYERYRDAQGEPRPLGRVLPFTKPPKPLDER